MPAARCFVDNILFQLLRMLSSLIVLPLFLTFSCLDVICAICVDPPFFLGSDVCNNKKEIRNYLIFCDNPDILL